MRNIYNAIRSKEIVRADKELSFVGKPHYVLTLQNPMAYEFDVTMPPNPVPYITDADYREFAAEVDAIVADPSYQFQIIDMVTHSIESFWKYKKLGGTWMETRAEALKHLDEYLTEALGKVEIQVSVYYKLDVFGDSITTGHQYLGRIAGDRLKACATFGALLDTARPYVIKRMEEDMKPLIEEDETKIENDMNMLNLLLKKYPNYKEILQMEQK
jgi:hypothetical protein